MNKREIKLLINQNVGRPFYVYGLFWPDGNCFYVGKGQKDRIFQHKNHSHNRNVSAIFRSLEAKKLEPEYEIFGFHTSERAAVGEEASLQKKYLPNGVLTNRMIGTQHIYSDDSRGKYKLIKECDALIEEHEIETSLRPKESESLKRWEWFRDFLMDLISKPKAAEPEPDEQEAKPSAKLKIRKMKPNKLTIRKLQGGKEYKKFIDDKPLTRKEAMLAHCYQCMGGYDEGKQDCQGKSCPLYQYYPYNNLLAGL